MDWDRKQRWEDHCGHLKEKSSVYVASCRLGEGEKWHDIVLYSLDYDPDVQYVCLRYGNEPSEYISPGSLGMFYAAVDTDPLYKMAANILNKRGHLKWIDKHESFRRQYQATKKERSE